MVRAKVVHCMGGYNVWGWDAAGELVFECLHLHETRHAGALCLATVPVGAAAMTLILTPVPPHERPQ